MIRHNKILLAFIIFCVQQFYAQVGFQEYALSPGKETFALADIDGAIDIATVKEGNLVWLQNLDGNGAFSEPLVITIHKIIRYKRFIKRYVYIKNS